MDILYLDVRPIPQTSHYVCENPPNFGGGGESENWKALLVPSTLDKGYSTCVIDLLFLISQLFTLPLWKGWYWYRWNLQSISPFINLCTPRRLIVLKHGSVWVIPQLDSAHLPVTDLGQVGCKASSSLLVAMHFVFRKLWPASFFGPFGWPWRKMVYQKAT